MRPPQNNKRMRGRNSNNGNNNRRGPNPLTRSFESNGPDIKVRGTAAHIAEKYVQLARDAHVAGDPVAAESYLQHAEHYFRVIAAAHLAQNPPPRPMDGTPSEATTPDDSDDDDFDGGINDRFTYRSPQAYQEQKNGTPFAADAGANEGTVSDPGAEQPNIEAGFADRNENRDPSRDANRNQPRFEGRNGNRFDQPRRDNRDRDNRNISDRFPGDRAPRNEFSRQDNRLDTRPDNRNDVRTQDGNRDGNRFDQPRRERNPRPDRNDFAKPEFSRQDSSRQDFSRFEQPRMDRGFEPRNEARGDVRPERQPRGFVPEIADVQPILPSFITAPVRPVVANEMVADERPAMQVEIVEKAAVPKVRRKRVVKPAAEVADSSAE